MNYIQFGENQYPVSFGYGALMAYEKATGSPVSTLFAAFSKGESSITDIATLIACGLENGARKAGDPQPYTPQDVADLLDDSPNPTDVITRAMQILSDSFAQPDEGAKKKPMTKTAPRLSGLK